MQISPNESRVLVLAPTRADAQVTVRLLTAEGVVAQICETESDLAHEIARGAGTAMLTDEFPRSEPLQELRFVLDLQPSWSELPVLLLARADSPRLETLRHIPGVVLLERPVNIRSMISAVQAALRARLRQYELRNQLERTRAANLELQRAARAKDDFLATLSHELRNPLSALTTAAELLDRGGVNKDTDHMARQVVRRQSAQMSRLLDDLLDVARITHGRLEIKKVQVELSAVVRAAVETVQPLLTRKGHAFVLTLPEREVILDADPVRLAQVIANLLTNAAKYTEARGHIDLVVQRERDELVFRVRDDGIGIEESAQADIFGMFSQLRPAIERSEGGLGIGLALAKALVEMHGGTIAVHSEGRGKGSEFTLRLPCAIASAGRDIAPADRIGKPARGLDIILADDNVDALESLATLLEFEGHTVRVARDGANAIALLAQRAPSVMLLDIGMPGMNGYEVAQKVRLRDDAANIYLVALTGWGQPGDKARAQQAGFDHHVTKPVDFEELSELLARVAVKACTGSESCTPVPAASSGRLSAGSD